MIKASFSRASVSNGCFPMLNMLGSGLGGIHFRRRHLRVIAEQAEVLNAFRNDELLALAIEAHFRAAQMAIRWPRRGKLGFPDIVG